MSGWISETMHDAVQVSFAVERRLAAGASSMQTMEAVENSTFGTVMLLDGAVQVTTADEFVYHEMMAHVPLVGHGAARRVLIIGGGDCGLAEEVLKHDSVEKLVQVEIDEAVVAFARTHLSAMNASVFADPRFDLRIGDGARYVAEAADRFDVILVDSTDPVGDGAVLFTEAFYRNVARCLNPSGIVVTQAGVPFMQPQSFAAGMQALSTAFARTSCYLAAVPTYFGGHMAFGWASQDRSPREDVIELQLPNTRYYTAEVHAAAFALPKFVKLALAG